MIRQLAVNLMRTICNAPGRRRFRGYPLQHNEILPSISLTNSDKWSLR
jgi:hypothetical protein